MAEQEPSRASNQAQSETQNRPQNEGQGSASGSRGGSRGGRRRGRGGRSRGQRQDGSAQGPGGRGNTSQTESATAPATAPAEPAASSAPESSGNSRNRRNRRGNRGAARGSAEQGRGVFTMGPRRQFGGRLTTNEQSSDAADQDASLRANVPEFVPGQPAPQRGNGQQTSSTGESQSAAQPRSRGNRTRNRKQDRPRQEVPKSTASELWQRIQDDIANWNYECRICTEEVTRKTEIWSCTTCWTVVHLECAHQWWDTSMKVNEESGDKSWRCPGCNSTLTDEPDRHALTHALSSATLDPAPLAPFSAHQSRAIVESTLSERTHECTQICHPGVCGTCEVTVQAKCYCGRVEKEMQCSKQDDLCDSYDDANDSWFEGSFSCENACGRTFAIVELAQAAPRLSGRRLAATVAKRFFTHHNLAVLVNHLARVSANVSQGAVILLLPINVIPTIPHFTTSRVTSNKYTAASSAESQSLSAATRARVSAMVRLVKMTVKCPCGNHKKEFKCLASTSNPTPNRPEVRCDEECERLDRNRRLAAALNIDPATHTNDHVPFSDDTLKLYKQFPKWGDEQESQYRVFAANKDEVRLRYEPMKNISRQFLHLLAEDFGFESKSEDHDIHRSVLVWKTDKFVSAPPKTLSQCVKIRATQAAEAAAAAAIRPPSPPVLETEPFNALVLTEPRFGLTNDDVNTVLAADLSSLQGFSFKVDFLNEEVLIKATVSYSAFLTPAPLEKSLEVLKPRIEQTIRREKLAENVLLCHSDVNGAITRREVPRRAGAGGWSAVAGRAASKPGSSSATEEAKPGRRLLLGLKKKKPQAEAGKVWAALDGDVEC
ncbi:fkbp12-associated protein 1 like protein [Fusarium sporotrichioides]|uniref:Fkbp12-associated protein 1 like protein n=1 Tax=Fusarium sporotrichioides TaxID=5514 RepID=A0A395RQ20_FUSSP|nr:fkbp12-associated protein 1 like protein [Fusarium sporotrichioides]